MAQARKFYEGYRLKPATVGEPGGVDGIRHRQWHASIGRRTGLASPGSDGCSVGLEVEDFDQAIAHLKSSGVKFKMEPFPTPVSPHGK